MTGQVIDLASRRRTSASPRPTASSPQIRARALAVCRQAIRQAKAGAKVGRLEVDEQRQEARAR